MGSKILSIILYSDATNCDKLGKSQLYPIYLSLGNILTWRRNKQDVKQLVGYLSIIKTSFSLDKTIVRQTFHKCLKIILEPIRSLLESGIDLQFGDKYIWFFSKNFDYYCRLARGCNILFDLQVNKFYMPLSFLFN